MNCLPIWDQSMDSLNSIIPPPPAPPAAAAISSEISSFMDDPLNSKMHANLLMTFSADPGLTERAASYSCFSSGNYGSFSVQFGIPEARKLSRGFSSQCLKANESLAQSHAHSEMGDGELGSGREDSSVTDLASANGESNVKKRKFPKRKGKVAEENDLNAKKCRPVETTGNEKDDVKPKEDQNDRRRHGKDNGPKDHEPPKDYIHVRARRGQATDSHSLAERVRREKISQRMKLLQDLVPGCNKITGKALMLDEIINYVQSLQRQVEFLSMKLAMPNPLLDFKLDSLISKESLLNQASAFMPNSLYHLDNLASAFSFGQQSKEANPLVFNVGNTMETHCSMRQLESSLHQSAGIQSFLDIFGDSASQVGNLWDDELHSVVRMDFGQNQEIGVTSVSFHEQLPISHMKLEL